MPVCSRCTGLYIGFIMSAAIILIFERKIRNKFPGRKIIATIAILFGAMVIESGLSLLKIIPAYNIARFITGYGVGWFLPIFLIPLINSVVFRSGICLQEQYFKKSGHFVLWIFSGLVLGLIFMLTYIQMFLFWSITAVAGLILLVAVLILTLVFAVNSKLRGTIQQPFKLLYFFLPAIFISLAFISISSYLKSIINPYMPFSYGLAILLN
jgi:uncharacterized membrane protein